MSVDLLVKVTDGTTDLDGGASVNCGCPPNLQFDGCLIGIALDKVLVVLGPYLRIVHKLADIFVASLFIDWLLSITKSLRFVNELAKRQ